MKRWLQRLRCLFGHDWVYDEFPYPAPGWNYRIEWRTCCRCGIDAYNPTQYQGTSGEWIRGDKAQFLRRHPELDVDRASQEAVVRKLLED